MESNAITAQTTQTTQTGQTAHKISLEQRIDAARKGIGSASSRLAEGLQKINLARLIDKMEQDQGMADTLERRNRDLRDEQDARQMMREAEAACTEAIESHLTSFVQLNPHATYEEWISDLHPENLHEGKLLEGMGKELDHRFYVAESDHRLLWNRNIDGTDRLEVAARSQMWQPQDQQPARDFLDSGPSSDPSNMGTQHTQSIPPVLHDFWADSLTSPTETGEGTGLSSNSGDLLDLLPVTDHSASISVGVEEVPPILPDTSTPNLLLVDFQGRNESSHKLDAKPPSELLWFQQP